MSKILFVKPAIEADAVWDPIRTCSYLGLWFMASLLKSAGHDVIYLDESKLPAGKLPGTKAAAAPPAARPVPAVLPSAFTLATPISNNVVPVR